MSKDGMLCCHIFKFFKHIGVDAILARYIPRRWTHQAIPGAAPSIEAEPDEMPPQSKKLVRQANLSMDFASLARVASGSDAGAAILRKHMRAVRTELNHFNKTKKKKQKVTAPPMAGPAPPQSRGTAHPGHIVATTTGPMAPNSGAQTTTGSSWSTPIVGVPKDPPKSTTKGCAKSKRLQSALELHPKRKNKCSFCNSSEHNAANCPGRLV